MSQCYDLVCIDCRVSRYSIGQTGGENGRYFYSDEVVYDFLNKHNKHRIRLYGEFEFDADVEFNYEVDLMTESE